MFKIISRLAFQWNSDNSSLRNRFVCVINAYWINFMLSVAFVFFSVAVGSLSAYIVISSIDFIFASVIIVFCSFNIIVSLFASVHFLASHLRLLSPKFPLLLYVFFSDVKGLSFIRCEFRCRLVVIWFSLKNFDILLKVLLWYSSLLQGRPAYGVSALILRSIRVELKLNL